MALDLDAIEARCNAASPGEWVVNPFDRRKWVTTTAEYSDEEWANNRDSDADFVANARQDIPALVAEVRRLRMEVAILSPPVKAEAPSGHVVIVCGGRGYADVNHVYTELDRYHAENKITLLVEGGANGADSLAREWAKLRGVPLKTVPAQWGLHGRQAGAQRNAQMLQSKPVVVLAFPGGKGTLNMTQAERKNVRVIRFEAIAE